MILKPWGHLKPHGFLPLFYNKESLRIRKNCNVGNGEFYVKIDNKYRKDCGSVSDSRFVWMQSEPGMGRISAENAEEQEFFSMLSDFILQQRQKEVIRQKRF